jgi:hypothetical protein
MEFLVDVLFHSLKIAVSTSLYIGGFIEVFCDVYHPLNSQLIKTSANYLLSYGTVKYGSSLVNLGISH